LSSSIFGLFGAAERRLEDQAHQLVALSGAIRWLNGFEVNEFMDRGIADPGRDQGEMISPGSGPEGGCS
jgi:hypothetical protein